jgi:hypothetical protein
MRRKGRKEDGKWTLDRIPLCQKHPQKYLRNSNKIPTVNLPQAIDAHRGGGRGEGGTSCTPYKDFEKLPHKNAIKMTPPPLNFSQPQVPPSKEFAKKPQGPPPGFPTTVHLCPKPCNCPRNG